MSERPFMQLYVSDFIGDTLHLSTEQIGAYMLLLMAMWNAGGKLPADDAKLARVVRMTVKKWRSISADLMAYFDGDNEHIRHNRLTKELQKSERKSELRASAGAKGGAAKSLKTNDMAVANAKQMPNHSPDTIDKKEPKGSQKKMAEGEAELAAVLSQELARAVIDHRRKIRSPLTARAAKSLADEFAKCPSPDIAAETMMSQGWRGFRADWLQKVHGESKPPDKPDPNLVVLRADDPDAKAVERLLGKPNIVGQSGMVTLRKSDVERAKAGALF